MTALDAEFLRVLACPRCKGSLEAGAAEVSCRVCGLSFPVREGLPVLLVEEARAADQERRS